MLRELVELWPGGPTVTLGSYLIAFKYVFSLLVLAFAVSLLRWPRTWWLVSGALVLSSTSLLVLQNPLGRAYGVVDDARGLDELGSAMVVAARGTASDGRMVTGHHPYPGWGLVVATLSGFSPERLLALYRWLPLLALVVFGGAVAWSAGGLEDVGPVPVAGVATFVVLLLSSHRLSFLRAEGPFWPEYFWLTPGLGVAMAALCVSWRCLGAGSAVGATLALVVVSGLEPRLAVCFLLGVVAWMVGCRDARGRWGIVVAGVVVAGVVAVVLVGIRALPVEPTTWHEGVNRVFSVTVDAGLLFLMAALGVGWLFRSERKTERLLACGAGTALSLWVVVSFVPYVAALLDPRIVSGYVRLMLALTASYGVCRALARWAETYPHVPDTWRFVPGPLRTLPPARLATMALVVVSLPWCFPYWWEPVRMDAIYVESSPAVSRRLLALGDALRETTDPNAVFVAGPSYATWIPALSGRRVLLTGESGERAAAQASFVESYDAEAIAALADEWNITHFAWGRLDQPASAPVDFGFFEDSPRFNEIYRDRRWVRVFAYEP